MGLCVCMKLKPTSFLIIYPLPCFSFPCDWLINPFI